MQNYDPELYELWHNITNANVENLYQAITENFETTYVFTDNKHKAFIKKARSDPHFTEVYQDQYTMIFRLEHGQLEST